ncbi:MAG: PEP-CTERM sorting domain-containing protein [Planctomycetes bacterium]|nr:PEP-CTERM sorting domain-containing protein [Planctomycetota bacterium]
MFSFPAGSMVTSLFWMGRRSLGAKLTAAVLAVSVTVAMPARAIDLDGGTVVLDVPETVMHDGELIGRIFEIGGRGYALVDGVGDGTGTGGLLGETPNVETVITGRIDYQEDGDFQNGNARGGPDNPVQSLGLTRNDDFLSLFIGTFTMKESGTLALGTERSDDPVRIYLDLNQNGVFETSEGELIATNGTGCCVPIFPPAFDLEAGDYLYAAVQHEFGGGSQIEPTFEITNTATTNIGRTTITPGDPAQAGFWSTGSDTDPAAVIGGVDVSDGGTLNVAAAVTSPELNISLGSTLNVNGGAAFNVVSTVNLGSVVINTGGSLDVSAGEFLSDGVVQVNGGTLVVDEDSVTVEPNHFLVPNTGAIETTGDLTAGFGTFFSHGVVIGDGLEVTVGGTLNVKPEAIVAVAGGKLNVSSVNNQGHIALLAGEFNFTGGNLVVDSAGPLGATVDLGSAMTLTVASGRLMVPAAGVVNSNGNLVAQGITNDGVISAIGGTWQVPGDGLPTSQGGDNSDGVVNNARLNLIDVTISGDVHSPAGSTIDVASGVVFQGLYSGAGTFTGSGLATFEGGFSPGDSPARVRMEGSVKLAASNTLYIELGGTEIGEFDQLDIRDNISIGGTLDVSLFGGFELSDGDVFPIIITGGDTTGQFIGLSEGATVGTFAGVDLLITYSFGDDNNVALVTDAPCVNPIGDFDRDCDTDFDDLAVLLTNWNEDVIAALGNIVDPDTTPVNADDLFALLANWTGPKSFPAPEAALADAAVPEPSTLVLALLAMLGLGACRRRRNRTA